MKISYKNKSFRIICAIMIVLSLTVSYAGVPGIARAATVKTTYEKTKVKISSKWKYAKNSKIKSGKAILYTVTSENAKNITVCINAGHGTNGGESKKTLCHPDGSPKIVSGSTKAGATYAVAVAGGMTFNNGTAEKTATLKVAKAARKLLLKKGYNVLMIREKSDVQLDNIARTLIANHYADCHIAIHYDSDGLSYDKGCFFCSIPNSKSYKNMEPVKSHWKEHMLLGKKAIAGLVKAGIKKKGDGKLPMDLTQTSYSTIPSIDLEVGNQCSDISDKQVEKVAKGIYYGVVKFFKAHPVNN